MGSRLDLTAPTRRQPTYRTHVNVIFFPYQFLKTHYFLEGLDFADAGDNVSIVDYIDKLGPTEGSSVSTDCMVAVMSLAALPRWRSRCV